MTDTKQVISFNYRLKKTAGEEIESSHGKEPLSVLMGGGGIIPGLEKSLAGRKTGDAFSVTVTPEEAYGEHNPGLQQRLAIKHLQFRGKLRAGSMAMLKTQQGPRSVRVVKAGRFHADVDANHPLAGMTLTFEVEVTDLRAASEAELEHGHAQGPGGHEHE